MLKIQAVGAARAAPTSQHTDKTCEECLGWRLDGLYGWAECHLLLDDEQRGAHSPLIRGATATV